MLMLENDYLHLAVDMIVFIVVVSCLNLLEQYHIYYYT
jgi:hypothetical protein